LLNDDGVGRFDRRPPGVRLGRRCLLAEAAHVIAHDGDGIRVTEDTIEQDEGDPIVNHRSRASDAVATRRSADDGGGRRSGSPDRRRV
jgi:hypothetical protein